MRLTAIHKGLKRTMFAIVVDLGHYKRDHSQTLDIVPMKTLDPPKG